MNYRGGGTHGHGIDRAEEIVRRGLELFELEGVDLATLPKSDWRKR